VLLCEKRLALVGLELAGLDFTVSEADDELTVTFVGPGHAGDRGTLGEFVADGFLVAPLGAETVDEDNAV